MGFCPLTDARDSCPLRDRRFLLPLRVAPRSFNIFNIYVQARKRLAEDQPNWLSIGCSCSQRPGCTRLNRRDIKTNRDVGLRGVFKANLRATKRF
jgi:hypothetical protein